MIYQEFLEKAAPNNKPMQPTPPIFTAENRVQIDPQVKPLVLGFRLGRMKFPLLQDLHDFEAVTVDASSWWKTHFPRRCAQKFHLVNAPEGSVNDDVASRWWLVAGYRSEKFRLLSSHSEKTSSFKLIKQGWSVHGKVPHILKPRLCINEIQQRSISFLQMVLRKTK